MKGSDGESTRRPHGPQRPRRPRRPRGSRRRPGHDLRPGLPVPVRRLDRALVRSRLHPGRTARRGSRHRRRRHLRPGRRVRADEARPQAGDLRGLADGREAALAGVRGRRGRDRRARRDAVPDFIGLLLPLRRQTGPADAPVPQPADRSRRKHGRRPGGRDVLRGLARRPSPAVHRGCRRVGAGPGGGALHRRPERDPGARRDHAQVVVERPRAPLGRPDVLRLRGELPGVLETVVPPSRGLRAGRFRYRRLGLGLPQLHAGDLPGCHDQLRHRPAPDRRRRRAGSPRAVALPGAPARPLAGLAHLWPRCTPARPAPASAGSPGRPTDGSRSPTNGAARAGTPRCW